jgi:peptidoglycan/xylan/chitin deacetylase (PgdA/CDA1 family)
MKKCLLFAIALLFFSCMSISKSGAELGIRPGVVIFSFDDGPNAFGGTTSRLLDILSKYEINAFFALLGENAERNPGLVRRIYNEGHYIINHGYKGRWSNKMNAEEFRKNLILGEAAITAALGHEVNLKLYRPHGGFYSSRQEKICIEEGYSIVPASVRVYDAVKNKGSKVAKLVLEKISKQGGGIILLHDGRDSGLKMEKELEKNPEGAFDRSWIPLAVEEIIIALLERGFVLNSAIEFTQQNF